MVKRTINQIGRSLLIIVAVSGTFSCTYYSLVKFNKETLTETDPHQLQDKLYKRISEESSKDKPNKLILMKCYKDLGDFHFWTEYDTALAY